MVYPYLFNFAEFSVKSVVKDEQFRLDYIKSQGNTELSILEAKEMTNLVV